jgi:cytochrome b6-f complex iron-sulfur subunit
MSDDPQPPPDPARRRLLDGAIAATACGAVASVGSAAVRFASPPDDRAAAGSATVPRAEVASAGSKLVVVGDEPVVVIALPGGEIRARSARCTHLGCAVRFERTARELVCPCHGGRFAADGRVLAGPPPSPLARFEVTDAGDAVVIERRRAWNA